MPLRLIKSRVGAFWRASQVRSLSFGLIDNKSVAVVGPAASALEAEQGSVIENCDVVIRVNRGYQLVAGRETFLGARTDVLFHGLDETPESGCGPIEPEVWRRHGVHTVVYPFNEPRFRQNKKRWIDKCVGKVGLVQVSRRDYRAMRSRVKGMTPTTGYAALDYVLRSRARSAFITGFTFFRGDYQIGYSDHVRDAAAARALLSQFGNHNPDFEFDAFIALARESSVRLRCDSALQRLMGSSVS